MSLPATPRAAYRFPLPPPAPPMLAPADAALARLFDTPCLDRDHLVDALQEHVFRSMGQGKRVREWCTQVTHAIERAPPSPAIGEALATPILTSLLPFTRLPSNPYFPTPEPPLPPPLLPNSFLATLTRNQLIDALARLSKEDRLISKKLHYEQELVLEACLEYIGRRWRSAETIDGNVVDDISRKLTEVEFEVHLQGYPPTVRNALSPVLHKLRHTLGFITSSQLVAKLNSTGPSAYPYPPSQPGEIVSSWVVRRLQAGVSYQNILHELHTVQSGLSDDDLLPNVLRPLGLADAFSSPSTPRPAERQPKGLSFKPKITPRWLSHKRANSSITKLHPISSPLAAADHRRPSLPAISSTSSLLTPPDGDRPSSRASVCSSLGCTDVKGVKSTLLGQLLIMRYHIHGHEDEGWFLGGGRELAEERLALLEARSGPDEELQQVFASLRGVFSLLQPALSGKNMHTRDVSFDLDQYIKDISLPVRITEEDDDEDPVEALYDSRCGTSALMHSFASMDSQAEHELEEGQKRVSWLSTFTIRKAVREEGVKHRAVEFRFPQLPQLPELAVPQSPDTPTRPSSRLAASRSVPDFEDGGKYTRLPRRILRKERNATRSALQLGTKSSSKPGLGLRIDTTTTLPLRPLLSPPPSFNSDLPYTFPDHSLPLTPTTCYSTMTTATGMATAPTPRRSMQMTDQTLARRQMHRQCVIFDGAPISPGTGAGMDTSGGEGRWSGEIPLNSPSLRASQASRSSSTSLHAPTHYPSPESPILSPTPTFHSPCSPSPSSRMPTSPVPLSSILALFQSLSEGHSPEAAQVEEALGRFVEDEQRAVEEKGGEWDAEARCRVAWLIEQVAELLNDPVYLSAISNVVSSLSTPPLSVTPATPALSLSPPPTPPASAALGLNLGLGTAPLNLSPVERAPSSRSFSHAYSSSRFASVEAGRGRGHHSASYC
ncbi:hypothetical protein I350_04617 [Cryptococcus amylolentus CBS 6273]|uniref:Uncharacterized protein n=1 Tax=Cryptococcus amylolentus CBS 6273 TaxID=1296118 RepID=A0A1E3K073_9TREE|nr:hypothetical protein I350_04617 [Cryptococcus amylolentus CBS 6273]